MLYMIGLGLADKKDISVNGLEAIKKSEFVFLENYTSILPCTKEELEEFYGKKIVLADRNMVEKNADTILKNAKEKDVAFLVVGDVFGATTHSDLFLRAKEKNIEIKIIHNASIINAVSQTGLELYKFGKTTSVVFDDDNWLPETPYNAIKENKERGLHTLCLLDIKTAEPSKEDMIKGINKSQPPRFMNVNQGIQILEKLEKKIDKKIITKDTLIIGIARLGQDNQIIKAGTIKQLKDVDFKEPLHSIIIPGKLHEIEKEMISYCLIK